MWNIHFESARKPWRNRWSFDLNSQKSRASRKWQVLKLRALFLIAVLGNQIRSYIRSSDFDWSDQNRWGFQLVFLIFIWWSKNTLFFFIFLVLMGRGGFKPVLVGFQTKQKKPVFETSAIDDLWHYKLLKKFPFPMKT